MRGPKKYREATLVRADGVVSSAKVYRPEDFSGLTTPSAALWWLRIFLFMPQPPLLFKAELSKLRVDGNVNCN